MVENLRMLRLSKGISQQKLAEQVGVTQQAIHQYETNISEPDIENLIRLADIFEVSVDFLINHQPKKDPEHINIVSNDEYLVIERLRSLKKPDRKVVSRVMELISSNSRI